LDGGYLRMCMYRLAFLRGDAAGMKQQLDWAAGRSGDEDALLSAESDSQAYRGQLADAREWSRRAWTRRCGRILQRPPLCGR
jgi:hypothetical protein